MRACPSRCLTLLVTICLVLATMPGITVAETRTGGSIVVEEGETVDGLQVFARSVVVRGTVDGDLTGAAGDVTITEGAIVGGTLQAGAGTVRIDGIVQGDVTVGAETIILGESASIEGDLTYDGQLQGNWNAVAGTIERDPSLGGTVVGPEIPVIADWVFDLYGFLVNLILGAILLLVFPAFSRRVADRAVTDAFRAGGVGLLTLIVVPLVLVLLAITIVGIPLTIIGGLLFALVSWVGGIYGRLAVGTWLLSYADAGSDESHWIALAVGFVVVAVGIRLPLVGWLVNLLVFLLGLGALVLA